MTLVELPCLGHGDPHELGLLQNVPKGANGTLQEGGKGNIGLDSFLLDELSGLGHLLVSLGTQWAVIPSGELVFQVPGRFSVSDQNQSVLVGNLLADDNTEIKAKKKYVRGEDSESKNERKGYQ